MWSPICGRNWATAPLPNERSSLRHHPWSYRRISCGGPFTSEGHTNTDLSVMVTNTDLSVIAINVCWKKDTILRRIRNEFKNRQKNRNFRSFRGRGRTTKINSAKYNLHVKLAHGQHVYRRKGCITAKIKFAKYSRNTLKHECAKIFNRENFQSYGTHIYALLTHTYTYTHIYLP